jgi:transcription antitermination factor NusG
MKRTYWYAIYTKPRWEKKIAYLLNEKGYRAYCPLNKVRRKWSDRYKIVEEPLFSSYVFINITEEEIPEIRMLHGVLNFVYWNGKPGIIKDSEIDDIKRFLNEYPNIQAVPFEIVPNSKVIINQGAMMGKKGVVGRVLNNIVELEIESLGYKLVAKIEKLNLVPLNEESNNGSGN